MILRYKDLSAESKALIDSLEIIQELKDPTKETCLREIDKEISEVDNHLRDEKLKQAAIDALLEHRKRLTNAKDIINKHYE